MIGLVPLDARELAFSSRTRTQERLHEPERELSPEPDLPGTQTSDLQLPELWGNTFLLCKPLRLWCFVTAVPAD